MVLNFNTRGRFSLSDSGGSGRNVIILGLIRINLHMLIIRKKIT